MTAGLKCPPEICPRAAIIRNRPKPNPIGPGAPAAMLVKPMKRKPNVPTISAASRLLSGGESMGRSLSFRVGNTRQFGFSTATTADIDAVPDAIVLHYRA